MIDRGRFIVFEGSDGSGKSTVSKRVAEWLAAIRTCEPTSGAMGQLLRSLRDDAKQFSPEEWALLFTADRVQHCRTFIELALAAGRDVICDRYELSTYVYQLAMKFGGAERAEANQYLGWLHSLNDFCLSPDLTIVLRVSEATARARMSGRGLEPDGFEEDSLQRNVRRLYDRSESLMDGRAAHVALATDDLSVDETVERCLKLIEAMVE